MYLSAMFTITFRKYRLLIFAGLLLALFLIGFLMIPVQNLFTDPTSTVILDRDGNLLGAKISTDGQWRFPVNTSIPDKYQQAVLAYEDKRFFSHPGFDPFAIVRALGQNIKSGKNVSGGSTITMQVIRISRKGKPRTVVEKMIEIVMAMRLELAFSKVEILSMYSSHAPFGGNVVGLDAASWRYFGHDIQYLSWAGAATLAVLPNSPALIHPGRNRQELLKKRNLLLERLAKKGIFSQQEYELALLEPIPTQPHPLPSYALHLLERIYLSYPGNVIHTSINGFLQQNAARIVHQYLSSYRANQINNAAILIIDNEIGQVLAYVGNASDPKLQLNAWMNDMIMAPRSSGSIFKPFLFAGMLSEGLMLSTTLVPDFPFQTEGFNPQNYNRTFDGAVPVYRALQRSLNVPAVRMLQQFGIGKFHLLLKNLGLTTLHQPPEHYGLSLVLGGAECTLWDITAMYARLSRILHRYSYYDGMYHPADLFQPTLMFSKDHQEIRLDLVTLRKELEPTGVLDASAIWETYRALLEVNRPEAEAGWQQFSSTRGVAWKTGTSYGNRDGWAIGTTPEYTVGVWAGNATGEGRPSLTGVGFAAPLLFDVFNLLPKTSPFRKPYDDMEKVNLCLKSGHMAGSLCSETDSSWIPTKGLRTLACPYHIPVLTDATGLYRVTDQCYEVHRMKSQSWFVLPPAMEWFYRKKHPDYKPLPLFMIDCSAAEANNPLQLIYPLKIYIAFLPRDLSGETGKIVLQAVHRNADAVVFWHLDGEYLGTTKGQHYLAANPAPGNRRLVLVDESGNRLEQVFRVALPK
ncbi:MAG: penicillin-binding protein 1C [Bacteroidales bacterium]|nr:penicillin-binding protein 1C [Bacteroidales bacterium]